MGKKEYYLGLNLSTTAVGWALTDQNYNLLKVKGKDAWGVREFEEALLAADRRMFRNSRRLRVRKKIRINFLKEYFAEAINDVDPLFYQRLDNSRYYLEDKDVEVRNKYSIFNDRNYKDTDYYKEYPTIFHLRKELLYNKEPHDVRLVYLALLNMFKHRGNFWGKGDTNGSNGVQMRGIYMELQQRLSDECEIMLPENVELEKLESILGSGALSMKKKADALLELFGYTTKDKKKYLIMKLLSGLNVNLLQLFDDIDSDEKIEVCLSRVDIEERLLELEPKLGNSLCEILMLIKNIYDIGVLSSIMKGYSYLSEARVAEYEKHGKDLKILKEVIREHGTPELYNKLFRSNEKASYSAYVKSYLSEGEKVRRSMKERTKEDMYKCLKKILKEMPQEENVVYILNEMEKGTFLPKQLTSSNSVIPNQVHMSELKKILENAQNYLPFLNEKDETGLTVSEKIIQLFEFQIPYYIGPTCEKGKTSWVVRKEAGLVLPWTLEEMIDTRETAEKFIVDKIRNCTYLGQEKVLPKSSLLYESYCVLNEINNLHLNGAKISVMAKQGIYNDLFKSGRRVSKKNIERYLILNGIMSKNDILTGMDKTSGSALITYAQFKAVIGEKIEEHKYQKMIEDIVFYGSVYGEEKKFLKERMQAKYADMLTAEQINRILKFDYKEWGQLSKEFLMLRGCNKEVGESVSLIRMMWETNYNVMELINDENYTYKSNIEEKQIKILKTLSDMTIEDLEEYYFTTPVKRMVWQMILVVREIEEIMGYAPARVFVKMSRTAATSDDSKKLFQRKNFLLKCYKNIKDGKNWIKEIEKAAENGSLRSKKLYLYFQQKGKCLYTGNEIKADALFDDSENGMYAIDHIYPKHYVKDENIDDNLVLVEKKANEIKSDNYPVCDEIYDEQIGLWKELYKDGLLSEEKFRRLTSRNPLTDEQKATFVGQQLFETHPAKKRVLYILEQLLPVSEVIFTKSVNVQDFRHSEGFPKSTLINEFYHAKDAYLATVVGNVYYTKFTQSPANFIKEYNGDKKKYHYNLAKMFVWDVTRNGEVAWVGPRKDGRRGTIELVENVMKKNTPLMTRMNFTNSGEISNQTLVDKETANEEKYIPFKSSDKRLQDVKKYGGFGSVKTAYFFLVEHIHKKKRVRTIETVPIYMKDKIKTKEDLQSYCESKLNLADPVIKIEKIKTQSLIEKNGYFYYISGKSGDVISLRNAVNLCLDNECNKYVKYLEKYLKEKIIPVQISKEKNMELYETLEHKHLHTIYNKKSNALGGRLAADKEQFALLALDKQCYVLLQMLNLTKIGITRADLRDIGESENSGLMRMNKNILDAEEIRLIHQSVTGLYQKSVDMLKI